MLDYHVHLWPHEIRADSTEYHLEKLARYCEKAQAKGVEEIALTEHLFRFTCAVDVVGGFWRRDPNALLGEQVAKYFKHHATADLDAYVEAVLAAKAAGLPVVLGLEVDYYPGLMPQVAKLLAGYPFDVLLGSIHWIGAWMFDDLSNDVGVAEWDKRDIDEVWRAYTEALEELAATKTCDVLAHPDLVKLTGRRASKGAIDECYARMAEAAAASAMAAELSSAGWRKPVDEAYPAFDLLERFHANGVAITTASDTHGSADVAYRTDELRVIAQGAGYTNLRAFRSRHGREVPISSGAGGIDASTDDSRT